jgi:lipopolysaccharide transport system ATP-binding protein
MKPIIKVENLGKQYQIGAKAEVYSTLRESIVSSLQKPFEFLKSRSRIKKDNFWALRHLSFEIVPGEIVGIIGRNGAGKSTLLKILSRITEPTTGNAEIYGRIGSLLEVGTGFHPELTGRENVFLNGAILGMKREEIAKKFDEIVDFSEVEKFIDTPVKRYSSGMYMRLAFAIAANLEPEILIIDEVLAVGDSEFQKKCLGKLDDVSKSGRTVLFVSHQLGTISQLCEKTLVLDKGELQFFGQTQEAIDFYSNSHVSREILRQSIAEKSEFQFLNVYNCDEKLIEKSEFLHSESIQIHTEVYCPKSPGNRELAISLYDRNKRRVFTIHEPLKRFYNGEESIKLTITIPHSFITPGIYSWLMCINNPGLGFVDLQDDVCRFIIIDSGSDFAKYENADYGCVFPSYSIKQDESTN